MLDIVVFSKDRAAQLDLLMQSLDKNIPQIGDSGVSKNVIYTASSVDFSVGYNRFQNIWEEVNLVYENKSFRDALYEVLRSPYPDNDGEYVLFFTDDDIVYREVFPDELSHESYDKLFTTDEELGAFSLRLGRNTFIQDPYTNTITMLPEVFGRVNEGIVQWEWKKQTQHSNFAYPFSVDGHIFRKRDVLKILDNTPGFYNPNSLEGKAQGQLKYLGKKMASLQQSCVVNTPLNRVQETCTNKAGQFFNLHAEGINQQWLSGKRILLGDMDFSCVVGCHQEIQLKWQ